MTIETCGSQFDTVLEVFDSCGLAAPIACNDDADSNHACPGEPTASRVTFHTLTPGPYYIRVGGRFGASGTGRFTILCENACPCDWNGSGALNSQDFFDFIGNFFGGGADFNNSGETNSQDFFDFLACFFSGC
jgi:hypothetical protein